MNPTATGRRLASLNPATGEVVGEVPITDVEAIPAIVTRAREAFAAWRRLTPEERVERLAPAGERFVEAAEELGLLMSREMGKPVSHGIGEAKSTGRGLPKFAKLVADAVAPESLEDRRTKSTVYHDPLGVCAAITPWNFPLAMPHTSVLPGLVAGNAVILKPSEETPLSGQAYVDVLNEFLPEGVLQIVHGDGAQGAALVAADVNMIAFTGSRATGKRILAAASGGLKRVVLELGGKDPMIVLADADLPKAAAFAATNSFRNSGQVCVSTERIYVDRAVAADFERLLVEQAEGMRLTGEAESDGDIGPMVNARQKEFVERQIEAAVAQGARRLSGEDRPSGNYLRPTVLANVNHDMEIMRDETFGPVACVQAFATEDEAVRLANDTDYGLGAVVFGGDRAAEVARQLDAGMIGVNQGVGGATGSPWVGAKESGYGFARSPEGHRQYTQVRVVSRPKDDA